MRKTRQSGFSLLELLVAMMIIAVIATLGFTKYREFSDQARYIKAKDTLQIVSSGLDQYYLKHGQFPSMTTFESLIDANSPLVKENMIPPNVPAKDPWGNTRRAVEASTIINRKDFGLVWNKVLEAGGVMVGEEVTITLDIELVQQAQKK